MTKRIGLAIAVVLATWPGPVGAQQGTAELRGVVVDQQGGALPGVTVTVRNQETGMFRETVSNPDGTYFVSGVIPGLYEIAAELSGFRKYARPDVRLEIGKTTTVEVRLEVGSIEDVITVTAEIPLVDFTSKEVGGNITSRDLLDLPSVNRNFIGFVGLLPGIVPNISTESFGSDSVTVNGADSRNNNYLLDGANNNDDVIGQRAGTQARTPIEAVQEFQVLTNQFDAEFGRSTGAIINAVTKQGTNRIRGSAFGFFQDASLTRRDYFAEQRNLTKPDTSQRQFGGTVGGPIVRDRAHYFFSLERVQIDRGTTINIPARPEFNTATTTEDRVWNTLLRFDQQLRATETWGVRWLRESSPQKNQIIPVAGRQVTLAANREETDVDQTLVGSLSSVLGSNRLNTLRVAFTRENVSFGNPNFNGNGRRQDLLAPSLQFLTFVDQQNTTASARINNAYQIEDTFAWFVPDKRGDHDFKFGVQYQYTTADFDNQTNLNGTFIFRTDNAFNAADPRTYPERLQITVPGASAFFMKTHFLSMFGQDKWRPTNALTLSLGLRYDLEVVPLNEADNPLFGSAGDYPVDKNNLAPRLGFAYTLNDRSVLRGGYGLFYDKTHLELISGLISAGAFSNSFTAFFPASAADPGPQTGQLPTDPMLRDGPTVNRDLLNQLFPPGSRVRNTGNSNLDNPDRRIPYTHQVSIGYERQLWADTSVSVDYIHAFGRDQFMTLDRNAGLRTSTSRTAAIVRPDPAVQRIDVPINAGNTDYDGVAFQFEKRFSRNYSTRVSYTLGYARGNTNGNAIPLSLFQLGDDMRLDLNEGPTNFDRRHNLVVSGSALVPRTGGLTVSWVARTLSGSPFSLIDSSTDPDRNGHLFDLLPAGSYTGSGPDAITVEHDGKRNGARGPAFFQLDTRIGYRLAVGGGRTLDLFGEVFNVTNRANFDPPVTVTLGHPASDRRLAATFLNLTALRAGAVPTTAQFGVRLGF